MRIDHVDNGKTQTVHTGPTPGEFIALAIVSAVIVLTVLVASGVLWPRPICEQQTIEEIAE